MKKIGISGVWKESTGEITHYAVHEQTSSGFSLATKTSKQQAIRMAKNPQNQVKTWVWNYQLAGWFEGETVTVVNGKNGEYLRSHPDKKVTDNLGHLIDCSWFY